MLDRVPAGALPGHQDRIDPDLPVPDPVLFLPPHRKAAQQLDLPRREFLRVAVDSVRANPYRAGDEDVPVRGGQVEFAGAVPPALVQDPQAM